MSRNLSKRISELSCWDLDAGCRSIVDQSTPANRRLKKIIRKHDKKRLDKWFKKYYNDNESEV